MGNYMLCGRPAATTPFHIESIQLNLYSIEEFCYFIANFLPLAEEAAADPSLPGWLEDECGMPGTADIIRSMMSAGDGRYEALKMILKSGHYYTQTQWEKICAQIDSFRAMRQPDRSKARADLLMKRNKYKNAIEEYEKILNTVGISEEPKEFRGKIQYDLGCAYARMFRLSNARRCFGRAYELIPGDRVRQACLAAAYLEGGQSAFEIEAEQIGADAGMKNTVLMEIQSMQAPEISGELDELVSRWIRDYHENTGL